MPNQTVLLKIGKGLRTPDFSSYCDFCPGRRGDGGEGKCVVQKASRPTGSALSHRNHWRGGLGHTLWGDMPTITNDSHLTRVLELEGVGPEKCTVRQPELGCTSWGVSLKHLSMSWAYRQLNTISFLLENGEGKCFTSGCNESKRQLVAREELNGDPMRDTLDLWLFCRWEKGRRRGRSLEEEILFQEGRWRLSLWEGGGGRLYSRGQENAWGLRSKDELLEQLEDSKVALVPAAPGFQTFQDLSCSQIHRPCAHCH